MKKAKNSRRLSDIVEQNIQTIADIEKAALDARSTVDRIADHIAAFCGSMTFLWVPCIWFIAWLLVNLFPPFSKSVRFDPPPFGILTLVVSLEAISLSTFILISQNRQQKLADQRNHLDLQINLLAEQESSHIITMLNTLLHHHGIQVENDETMALQSQTNATKMTASLENKTPDDK